MVVNGVNYDDKAEVGQANIDVCKILPDSNTYHLIEYRGLNESSLLVIFTST